ncbi:MAG: tetratricopeptide repeat protein [Chloroflexi bacterium]|nr:tetratricopeptide repeat protein [Chloroflexota bacterium]
MSEDKRTLHELINEGAKLLSQHKAKEAAVVLEKAYYMAPDDVDVKINLGGAYIMQGRFNDAIPILEEAAQQAPDNPMVWTNLAAAYLGHLEHAGQEQQDAAIAAFKRALQADPQAPNVDYNLGLIYLQRGDLPTALAHFQRAVEVNPADKDAQYYVQKIQAQLSAPPEEEPEPPSSTSDEETST